MLNYDATAGGLCVGGGETSLSRSQFHSLGIPWVGLDGVHVGVDHSTARRLVFKSCHNFCSRNEKDASELGDCDYTHAELSCLSVYQAK